MDVLTAINERRSIRVYSGRVLTDAEIQKILRAGMQAPSAGNQQPWEFIIINNKDIIRQIPLFHPHASMVVNAGALIMVCGNKKREIYKDYWVQDCSAASQNMLLAAKSMGIGGVWLSIHPMKDRIEAVKMLLNLPDGIEPLNILSFGIPDEDKPAADRFNTEFIHYNGW